MDAVLDRRSALTMMFWYGDHTSGWGIALMSLGMIVFWGLLIFGFVMLLRSNSGPAPDDPAVRRTPEQILAERFAHGEIDEAEYARRLDTLHGKART
jgi:putative membrane protein